MKSFLPLIAAGILGALFAGAAVYQATRLGALASETSGAKAAGCGGACCGAK